MGKKAPAPPQNVINQAQSAYTQNASGPSPTENEFTPVSQGMTNNYTNAVQRNTQDYGNIMGAYENFRNNLGGPTKFNFQNVTASRPQELGESYGILREALPTYREFAQTGGYSPTDIQELRARGTSPIRAAYANTQAHLDRANALAGGGGAANYIAASSRAQRDLPGQMADAMTGVNAQLAEDIRSGRLAGAAGIRGVGGDIGGLASQEAGRQLQASLANQDADLRAQQLSEQSLQNLRQSQLASMGGQASLYGTTPGMSSMFGNQMLQGYGLRNDMQNARNNYGLGLLNTQLSAYGANKGDQGTPWWQQALGIGGTIAGLL